MEIRPFHRWFGSYARSYLSGAPLKDKRAIGLKLVHSQKVRGIAKRLALHLDIEGKELFLAELCGLFHDIGRLPQFKRYKTFLDAKSEDHAALSVEVLKNENVLSQLEEQDKNMVIDAISVHNKFSIPAEFKGFKLTLAKILRDADKIDIWRVFDEFYKKGKGTSDINLGLPYGQTISEKIINDFCSGYVIRWEDVKNQLDFMVMRLSWLFDINFEQSLGIIAERNYIDTILNLLPDEAGKRLIKEKISNLFQEKLGK